MTHSRRLILIRHAKSGWDDPFADDHARTLTARGETAASRIGTWLETNGFLPTKLISSDAARTKQTTASICAALSTPPEVVFAPLLYHAAPDTIRDLALRDAAPVLAFVGHNPGIGMLAHALVKTRPNHHRFDDYPTCATAVIDFPAGAWMKPGQGICTAFIVPRDLP